FPNGPGTGSVCVESGQVAPEFGVDPGNALSGVVLRKINGIVDSFFFFKQKTAYEIGLGIPAEPLFRSPPTYPRRAPLRLPLVPRNGCGRPGRAPERFLPLDITSLLLHVIFDARFLLRQ